MKPLLVLSKIQQTYFLKRLIEEVGGSGVVFHDPWSNSPLAGEYDQCLVRTSGVYGGDADLNFLTNFEGVIINPLPALQVFRRKSSQYRFYEKFDLPHLPWMCLSDKNIQDLNQWIENQITDYFILKPDRGQAGRGVELHSAASLIEKFHSLTSAGDQDFVVQTYLSAPEYRVFFIDQEFWTLRRESASGEVTSNFFQEGVASVAELPDFAQTFVARIIQTSGARYGALDLLITAEHLVILELNIVPGMEQLEQVTGLNIMSRLLSKLGIL